MEALRKVLEEDVLPKFQRVFMKEDDDGGGGGHDEALAKLQAKLWTPEHTGRLTSMIQEQVRRAVVGAG